MTELTYSQRYYQEHKEQSRKQQRKWYEEHEVERRIHKRKYTHKIRMKLIQLLGSKCIKCGETDWRCLQIDHVNGNGLKQRKLYGSQYNRKSLEAIKAGSKDYQLLCANCNWKKRYENKEGYKGVD